MYRNNPFHNFEHASHVTMSMNKLLQRVVAPDLRVRRRSLNISGNANASMASDLHSYTYGITSDPLTQLAVVFAALIRTSFGHVDLFFLFYRTHLLTSFSL